MGFLNHATNNIIIDAVLTDRGRELLSRNDGSFNIKLFSFGDDEVDYTLINKYGMQIGKEKIEKNTPIFEANPNKKIAIKYPLRSFSNPLLRLKEIPSLIRDDSVDNTEINMFDIKSSDGSETGVKQTIKIKNSIDTTDITSLDNNITDSKFYVKVNDNLIKMTNGSLVEKDLNGIATYEISTRTMPEGIKSWNNQVFADITLNTLGTVTSTSFTKQSIVGDANKINTTVQVIGAQSGSSIVIPVLINKRTTTSS